MELTVLGASQIAEEGDGLGHRQPEAPAVNTLFSHPIDGLY
jgi:hypothetical protein